jgi:beta-lactam-binding protein with PASTA domain
MNFFDFIRTRVFVRHFLLSVVLTALAIALVLGALKWYTHHGESVIVPSLVGLTPNEINQLETISDIEVIISDSVFDSKLRRGSVITQDPLPGSSVKRNRKVYLTTVAIMPEKAEMPNLVDLTLRQASATLETYGLKLGRVTYVPDIAANAVLAQFYKNEKIEPGFEILKGSVIDLRVGESSGGGRYKLPFLIGKTRQQALDLLNSNLLILGEEEYEDDADPETARVYSQNPSYTSNRMLNVGQPVSLVFKDPSTFDFDAYLQEFANDTVNTAIDTENNAF